MQYVSCILLLLSSIVLADSRSKIAVIDTGISSGYSDSGYLCKEGHKDFSDTGIEDRHGHGTMIFGAIAKRIDPSTNCIVIIKWIDWGHESPSVPEMMSRIAQSVEFAAQIHVDYINMSLAGPGASALEEQALSIALNAGIFIAVAAGNDNIDLSKKCTIYPACYRFKSKNFRVVANYDGFMKWPSSNYGGPVNELENGGTGDTSLATAIFLGKHIRGSYENKCTKHTCPAPNVIRMRR